MREVLVLISILTGSVAAGASTWQIDPNHTSVDFAVRHLMVSTVRGQFAKTAGSAESDDQDYSKAKVTATIDADSIDTRVAKRDAHLKSPDFLDVAKYPTITFASKRVEKAGEGHWKVVGDLTLHGVTREVTLDVEGPSAPVKDPMGGIRAGAHATTKINRSDFGIAWNKALDGGGVLVGDEVAISIDVEAVKQ